jgi:hypothetical protein
MRDRVTSDIDNVVGDNKDHFDYIKELIDNTKDQKHCTQDILDQIIDH